MRAWSWLLAVALAAPALGDVLYLNDGTKVEGALKREPGGWVVTDSAGKATHVGEDRVASIEKSSNLSAAEMADSRLASLRRATENLADPAQGVERFTKFIEQNKGTKAAADAQMDVAAWRDRVNRGLVKVGGAWMDGEQRAVAMEKIVVLVEQAREEIKQGKMRNAETTIGQILALDPNNPSGLYLKGIVAFKQDQVGAARKYYETLRDILPDHAPTLNNLAVVYWQQRQLPAALLAYDQAMAASPKNRQILDNVAEALNGLSERDSGSTVAKAAAKRFIEQDTELQKELGQDGQYRWGATWVSKTQLEEVKAAQAKNKVKRDALEKDYEQLREKLRDIDRRISINDATMRRIASERTIVGGGAQVVQIPMPSVYYEIKRDSMMMRDDGIAIVRKLDEFPAKVRGLDQEMPVPAYTGRQRIIEAEGTPLGIVGKPMPKGGAVKPVAPRAGAASRPGQ